MKPANHIAKKPHKDAIRGHWWLAVNEILNEKKIVLKPLYASYRGIQRIKKPVSQYRRAFTHKRNLKNSIVSRTRTTKAGAQLSLTRII